MKNDKAIYSILAAFPECFPTLTGIPLPGVYHFESISLKAMEKTVDGVLLSDDKDLPNFLIEFQAYKDDLIYERILWSLHYWRLQRQPQAKAILWFSDETFDPKTEPWHSLGRRDNAAFQVVYLQEALNKLSIEHPLKALFLPLLIDNLSQLENEAALAYQKVTEGFPEANADAKATLLDVFFSWLSQRFTHLSKKEIEAMLHLPKVPIEQTRFYQDIRSEALVEGATTGMEKGLEKGMEKGLEKGLEKGRLNEQQTIARKMLAKGLELRLIAEVTGLSIEKLQALSIEK